MFPVLFTRCWRSGHSHRPSKRFEASGQFPVGLLRAGSTVRVISNSEVSLQTTRQYHPSNRTSHAHLPFPTECVLWNWCCCLHVRPVMGKPPAEGSARASSVAQWNNSSGGHTRLPVFVSPNMHPLISPFQATSCSVRPDPSTADRLVVEASWKRSDLCRQRAYQNQIHQRAGELRR